MSDVTYRDATDEDLGAICRLGRTVNDAHHMRWPTVFAAQPDPHREREQWATFVNAWDAKTVVVEDGDMIVGFINAALEEQENPLLNQLKFCRIGSVCVMDSHRRRGIGRELMHRVEAWARAHGAEDLRLHVWSFNAGAIRMYEQLGYTRRSLNMGKCLGE